MARSDNPKNFATEKERDRENLRERKRERERERKSARERRKESARERERKRERDTESEREKGREERERMFAQLVLSFKSKSWGTPSTNSRLFFGSLFPFKIRNLNLNLVPILGSRPLSVRRAV